MELSESDSLETGSSSKKSTDSYLRPKRSLLEVWRFFHKAFSSVHSSANDPNSILDFFNIIKSAFVHKNFGCHQFTLSPFQKENDEPSMTDYALWVTGQCFHIVTSPVLSEYSHLASDCYKTFLNSSLNRNSSVFSSTIDEHFRLILEFITLYKNFIKNKESFVIKGFIPTQFGDVELNNTKVIFITEFKIDSHKIALNAMKHFIVILDSCKEVSCYNSPKLLYVLEQLVESCKEIRSEAIPLSVYLFSNHLKYTSSRVTASYWMSHLIQHSLVDMSSIAPCFSPLISWLVQNNPSEKLDEIFHSVAVVLCEYIETHNSTHPGLDELCKVCCSLLRNITLDCFTEKTVLNLVKHSIVCPEIFSVARDYLTIAMKSEKKHLESSINISRGLKRKRSDVEGKFQNAIWDEMIVCLLESFERHYGGGQVSLDCTCTLISYLVDTAMELSEDLSRPSQSLLSEKIIQTLLLFFELTFRRCRSGIFQKNILSIETAIKVLKTGARFFQMIVTTNINKGIISHFNDLYSSIFTVLVDKHTANPTGDSGKDIIKLYTCILEFFVFYVQLPNCQQDVIDLMWPLLISSIRQETCKTIFKESIGLLILATSRINLQVYLIDYLAILLSDECIIDSIRDISLGSQLLCLTSSSCFLKRKKYSYELVCKICRPEEGVNKQCPDLSNKLGGLRRNIEIKYMEMISALDPNIALLKNYLRYAKHSTRPKSSFFKYLYSPSASVRFQVYLTLKETIADKSDMPLFNTTRAVSIICNLMNTDEFWRGGHLTKLLYQLINLLALNEKCFILGWKIIFFFCATGLNFDSMRVMDSLNNLVTKHNTTLIQTLQKYKEDFSMVLELLIIHNIEDSSRWNLSQLIESVKAVFDFDDGKTLLKSFFLPTLLPHLFIFCPKNNLVKVLTELADYLGISVKSMVDSYFDDIYTECWFGSLIDGQKLNLVDLFYKLETCSGRNIQSLVSTSNEMLICKFMLNAAHPSILVATRFLFLRENENLRSVLCSNMLGCLTYIDMCLQSSDSSQLVLNKCLKCLPKVITLLGPTNVSNMRFKLLSTLTSCLALHPNINPQLYFAAWFTFLCCVDLRLIGPSLGSIFSSLVPLVDKVPQIADLLKFLVISLRELYTEFLPDLYFLQDSKSEKMHHIYRAIQKSLVKSQGDYKEDISRILRHIGSKDTDLKLHSINRLHQLLKQHSTDLHLLIVKSDQLHPLIVKIIDCLMIVLRDSNASIRNACAACIGELGAIDPGRFSYNLNQQALNKKLICVINSVEFAHVSVSGLIQGLQNAKNLQVYNKFVGAIQETLKLYFKKDQSQVCKEALFDKFVPSMREMLETLLAARYCHMVPDISKFKVPHPIFGSKRGSTVEDWVYSWSVKLISFINDPFDTDLLIGCAPCMKIDIQFAITLLPYILLRALVRCKEEERQMIEEEVKAVLHWKVYSSHQHGISHIWKRIGACSDSVSPMFGDRSLESSRCIGIIFDLFDFLYKYATDPKIIQDNNPEIRIIQSTVKDFLSNFPHKSLFVQSYVQKDYCRSLWHIEKTFTEKKLNEDSLEQLRNVYSKLNDADGLVGVMGSFEKTLTTEETVLCHVVRGNLLDALNGYRMLADKYPKSGFFQRVLIQCYLSIDQPSTALQITRAIKASSCPTAELFNEYVESLWTNLRTDEMENLLSKFDPGMRTNWCWGVNVGQILSDMEHSRPIHGRISSTRQKIVDSLATLSQDKHVAYRQGYQYILKLHMLNELEKFASVFEIKEVTTAPGPSTSTNEMDLSLATGRPMQLRLALLTPNSHDLHQVLRIRRVALSLVEKKASLISPQCIPVIHKELLNIWVKNLTIARKSGNTDGAAVYISMAEQYPPVGLFVEKAKLLNARNQPDAAVVLLRQGISQYFSNNDYNSQHRSICAKAKLLIAQYNDENIKVDVKDGGKYFKEALDVCPWEKAYVALAQYLYSAVTSDPPISSLSPEDIVRMEYETAYNFGMAMMYGSQYIYQSMPCMLSLWLDFVTRMVRTAGNQNLTGLTRMAIDNVHNFNKMIDKFSDVLPAYMFMTAFSQLVSRMGHPYEPSFQLLKKIIVKMIISFPQQACWTFVSTLRSPHTLHKKRSMEILKDSNIIKNSSVNNFIEHFKDLVNKLICLSLKDSKTNKKCVPLESLVKGLKELLKSPIEIMVPAQTLRTVALPYSKYDETTPTSSPHYNPFPENLVYLTGVRDEVEILQSLQMPKKVVFIGSDGTQYPLICKPKDDLRLDSRIMEFNSIVNMYLRRDPKTREKNLHIRTYSVVPLSNQCGLIEFIPNLLSFKLIINQIFKKKGLYELIPEIHKTLSDKRMIRGCLAEKRVFFSLNLMKHPPVLQEWFFDQFQNPQTWYLARRGFIRTAAVMSIVGYMEGLGDRHCENILVDSTSGDLVHVDFNCLFNKAETFLFPEVVPFRLTQNMLSVMGPTGYEGTFVRSCEETTRVMRKFTDHLVATMKPFLHDPKIFDSKDVVHSKEQQLEYTNEIAKSHIDNVQKRLTGVVMTKNRFTRPLSVEGQVRLLIAEAINVDNLAQMFPGWTPHI